MVQICGILTSLRKLSFQASKIGDLIVRSLDFCQKYVRSQYGKDPVILARAILETNEIVLVCFVRIIIDIKYSISAAHDFRTKQRDVYAVDKPSDSLKLPGSLAPWTSSPEIISGLSSQYDATLSVLREFHASASVDLDASSRKTRQQTETMEREDIRLAVEETLASLAEMLCKICVERVTWCNTLAEAEQDRTRAEEIWNQYLAKRGDWIKSLGMKFKELI
jgi:Non-repetitive/WGA-negative nucleoporin C-terminal